MPEHPHNFTDATFCVPRITHPAPRTTLESHVPHTTRHAPLESASGSTTHPWATSRERIPQGGCLRLPFDIVCLGCLRPQRQFINRYPPLCVIHIHNRLVSVRPRICATSSRTRAKTLTPARGLRKPLRTLRKPLPQRYTALASLSRCLPCRSLAGHVWLKTDMWTDIRHHARHLWPGRRLTPVRALRKPLRTLRKPLPQR